MGGLSRVFRWLVNKRTGLVFSLAAGLLIAIAIVTVSARRVIDRYEAVQHTTNVLVALDGVLSAVTDAETSQRGFLITGDEHYMAPSMTAAAEAADGYLQTLRALTAGDARRQRYVETLTPLVTAKLTELRETVQLRRAKGAEAALQRILTGRGLELMQEVRAAVASVKAEERQRLTEETARHADQARRIFLALSALTLATLAILVILGIERWRRAGEMEATRRVLQTQVAEHEQTRALLAAIVQSSDDAVIGVGLDGRILTWNAGAEKLFGLAGDAIGGQPLETVFPAGSDEIADRVRRVQREQTTERLAVDHARPDGGLLHIALSIFPIRAGDGEIMGVSLIGRDTTPQALAEVALRRSEGTSRAFLESASEGIVVADAAGRIVLVNAKTEEMFGYRRAELLGQPVEMLLPTRLRSPHVGHRAAYMAAPRSRPMGRGLDLAGLKKGGAEFPVEVSLSYVESDDSMRAIAFVTDISERVAFQRAARQADKLAALGTLSAGIAHEINNPIGIITSRVEVMMLEGEEGALPPEMRKDLEVILRHARRVAGITQGLLSFARRSPGVREPASLNRIVEEIVQLARKDMSRARVEVIVRLDETLPLISADTNAIGQVLLNLLTNARRAMPEGGEITIETRHLADERSVRLLVGDTGSGIPPDVLPRIFDPFFTTKADGTGLGLAISHGIVLEHHGTIEVESEPGKGTMFTLTFPVDAPAVA